MSKARQALATPLHYGRGLGVGLLLLVCLFMTACSKDDKSSSTIDKDVLEKSLVGLWWDEFEYADVTETGEPFSRVLLAVDVAADHTGCIYLGVFDDVSDEAVAVYGGYEDTGFLWQLLDDGSLQLADPVTGETWALTRSDGGGNYVEKATDASSTKFTIVSGRIMMSNAGYSGKLAKANAQQKADIEKKLSSVSGSARTNLGNDDDINIDDTSQGEWGR